MVPVGAAGDPERRRSGRWLNRDLVGRRYESAPVPVEADDIVLYAEAVGEENPRYLDRSREGGLEAPPLFGVRILNDVIYEALKDPELHLNLLRLVHLSHESRWFGPLREGDVACPRVIIQRIEDRPGGQSLRLLGEVLKGEEVVVDGRLNLFVRGRRKGPAPDETDLPKPPPGEPAFRDVTPVSEDQTLRYAEASGDWNPIHLDERLARAAGLPGIILQGLCTMAFMARAVVDHLAGGDPAQLTRLVAHFSKPVRPGDSLTTLGWTAPEGPGRYVLEVRNQQGDRVIRGGLAEVTQAGS